MTFDESIAYLAGLVNYEQQSPSASDLALAPIRSLLAELGNPHDALRIIHITGTNGKGSQAILLDEILTRAGYRTGRYTTPAIGEFADQIRVGHRPIDRDDCARHVIRIRVIIESAEFRKTCPTKPTYFDVVTALAFLHFAERSVEFALIEVGLGGRTDSTNVCTPIVSVITNIGHDHMKQLGRDLRQIAREKAGIIKPGRPCVIGAMTDELSEIMASACERNQSPLTRVGRDVSYCFTPGQWTDKGLSRSVVTVKTDRRDWPPLPLNLLGEHQGANAALAVAVVEALQRQGVPISDEAVSSAFSDVNCPARITIIRTHPLILLDCSHNAEAATALITTLVQSFPGFFGPNRDTVSRRRLIFGASRDKEIATVLAILTPHFDETTFTSCSTSPRAADRSELELAMRSVDPDRLTNYVAPVHDAVTAMERDARPGDFIVITGSVFLASECLRPYDGSNRDDEST